MAFIESVTLDVPDLTVADAFYAAAFGLGTRVRLQAAAAPTSGFRGFTLSLVVSQPATVMGLVGAALDAGATSLKPAAKSFWGFGGVVRAPDGTMEGGDLGEDGYRSGHPADRADRAAARGRGSERQQTFYVDRGLAVARSFGSKYVEFAGTSDAVKLALYKRRALAKDAGVSPEGSGSHRLTIRSDAGSFTDPDGFAWQAASP
jgi:hypothetical protein